MSRHVHNATGKYNQIFTIDNNSSAYWRHAIITRTLATMTVVVVAQQQPLLLQWGRPPPPLLLLLLLLLRLLLDPTTIAYGTRLSVLVPILTTNAASSSCPPPCPPTWRRWRQRQNRVTVDSYLQSIMRLGCQPLWILVTCAMSQPPVRASTLLPVRHERPTRERHSPGSKAARGTAHVSLG